MLRYLGSDRYSFDTEDNRVVELSKNDLIEIQNVDNEEGTPLFEVNQKLADVVNENNGLIHELRQLEEEIKTLKGEQDES